MMPTRGQCREFISQLHRENLETEAIVTEERILTLRGLLPLHGH
ncbi:MAG: hypothetical protein ACYCYF_04835 [Anaerolineae bacterium]